MTVKIKYQAIRLVKFKISAMNSTASKTEAN